MSHEEFFAVSKDTTLSGTSIDVSGGAATGGDITFQLIEEIGQGGMGVVYRAQQKYPRRVVALKLLKGNLADAHARRRFSREVEILARLNHRGIAQLFSAGTFHQPTGGDLPFLAMEYVPGETVTTFSRHRQLTVQQRVELFVRVCDIVAYAHREGVVHRDLKPSNILVTADGEPKVLDFGLAGALEVDTGGSILTIPGQVVGTLEYMSPEQADGMGSIDAQSDVYSLGVMLYEILSTQRLLQFSNESLLDAVRVVRETTPKRLSQFNRALKGDLETIVHKALSKEKGARYGSVEAFAADLRRWLGHEPIRARPPSAWYQASRFVRRHRGLVTAVSMVIVALSVGLVAAINQTIKANAETSRANQETSRANEEARIATKLRKDGEEMLAKQELQSIWQLLLTADMAYVSGNEWRLRALTDEIKERLLRAEQPLNPVLYRIWQYDQKFAHRLRQFEVNGHALSSMAMSSDRQLIAFGSATGQVEIRDTVTNAKIGLYRMSLGAAKLQFSPDGKHILGVSPEGFDVWESHGGKQKTHKAIKYINSGAVEITNESVVFADGGTLYRQQFDDSEATSLAQTDSASVRTLRISPTHLTYIDREGRLRRLSTQGGTTTTLAQLPASPFGYAISPDGEHVLYFVAGSTPESSDLILIRTVDGKEIFRRQEYHGDMKLMGFADEKTFYVYNRDRNLLVRELIGGGKLSGLPIARPTRATLHGDMGLTIDSNGKVMLWDFAPNSGPRRLMPQYARFSAAALSRPGHVAALAPQGERKIFFQDSMDDRLLDHVPVDSDVEAMAFNHDSTLLAAITSDDKLLIWNLRKRAFEVPFPLPSSRSYRLDCNGDTFVVHVPATRQIHCFYPVAGRWETKAIAAPSSIEALDFSPDGQKVVALEANTSTLIDISFIPGARELSSHPYITSERPLSETIRVRTPFENASTTLPAISSQAHRAVTAALVPSLIAIDAEYVYAFDIPSRERWEFKMPASGLLDVKANATAGSILVSTSGSGVWMLNCFQEDGRAPESEALTNLRIGRKLALRLGPMPGLPQANPSIPDILMLWSRSQFRPALSLIDGCRNLDEGTRVLLHHALTEAEAVSASKSRP